MKQSFFLFFIFSTILLSCSNRQASKLLSPNNLTSYFATINSDSAYNLKTPNGALIKISANTFEVGANTKITIEIKEAYSLQSMLLAGLTTESNGRPLRSAGMLYLSASVNNKELKFLKPVQSTIPAKSYDSTMQVFNAEIKDDSTINWINPQPPDTSPAVKNLLAGKLLFKSNCANCHKPVDDLTGPALAGARQRAPDAEWPYRFINNTNTMLVYDRYARDLSRRFGSRMTQFNLTKPEIKSILDYCDNEGFLISNSNSDTSKFLKVDHNCGYDTFYYSKPKENIEVTTFLETPVDTSLRIDTSFVNNSDIPIQTEENNKEQEFSKKGYKEVMPLEGIYQFNITTSGWYNIDVVFNDKAATQVELFARVQMQEKNDMTVYLCIPERKILTLADKHNDDIYIFQYSDDNGHLPLVLNDNAFIFATATIKNKIYYGITKFKVQLQQTVLINIKESSKEKILSAFKSNELDSIKLDIEKKEMEIIKKPCNGISDEYEEFLLKKVREEMRRYLSADGGA